MLKKYCRQYLIVKLLLEINVGQLFLHSTQPALTVAWSILDFNLVSDYRKRYRYNRVLHANTDTKTHKIGIHRIDLIKSLLYFDRIFFYCIKNFKKIYSRSFQSFFWFLKKELLLLNRFIYTKCTITDLIYWDLMLFSSLLNSKINLFIQNFGYLHKLTFKACDKNNYQIIIRKKHYAAWCP